MVSTGYSSTQLTREACVAKFATSNVARVLVTVKCLPVALPVTILHANEDAVTISTTEINVINAAHRHDVISLQVDGTLASHELWSVTATGIAELAVSGGDASSGTAITVPLSVINGTHAA
jgi:nitroimidazol reductase NimA-like FMN-containing flavoprotein (pyridoxamine 5'-phosphate oxidase superfamily)